MLEVNQDYLKLRGSYLFSEIGKRVNGYAQAHPDKKIIRLGIGDVTKPLPPAVITALHKAVDEMAAEDTFRGYAPDLGYEFLRNAIADVDYKRLGCDIAPDEIFVSDGAKCDFVNPCPEYYRCESHRCILNKKELEYAIKTQEQESREQLEEKEKEQKENQAPIAEEKKETEEKIKLCQKRNYIFDKQLPYWILYRNFEFDELTKKIDLDCFDVFRDRQITNSILKDAIGIIAKALFTDEELNDYSALNVVE